MDETGNYRISTSASLQTLWPLEITEPPLLCWANPTLNRIRTTDWTWGVDLAISALHFSQWFVDSGKFHIIPEVDSRPCVWFLSCLLYPPQILEAAETETWRRSGQFGPSHFCTKPGPRYKEEFWNMDVWLHPHHPVSQSQTDVLHCDRDSGDSNSSSAAGNQNPGTFSYADKQRETSRKFIKYYLCICVVN